MDTPPLAHLHTAAIDLQVVIRQGTVNRGAHPQPAAAAAAVTRRKMAAAVVVTAVIIRAMAVLATDMSCLDTPSYMPALAGIKAV